MDDMQQKLNTILSNPDMMQQLMGMAQSLGQSQSAPQSAPHQQASAGFGTAGNSLQNLDINTIQRIAGLAQQAGIDANQQGLLKALSPYLTTQHINKLEKAMRAAKLAGIAGTFLGSNPLFSSGR